MKKTNETLVGLRGLLALSIVLFHIYGSAVMEAYISELPKGNLLNYINAAGPISVNLFFIISGYLITKSLKDKKSISVFFLNRILRIYPVFLIIHLMIFAIGPFIEYKWMNGITFTSYSVHFISNLLLLPGVFPLPIAQIVAWSLSYELTFYIFAGIIFFVYHKPSMHKSLKYIFCFTMLITCAIILYLRPNALFFIVGVSLFFTEGIIRKWYKPLRVFYLNGFIWLGLIYLSYNMSNFNIWIPLSLSFLFFMSIIMEQGLLSAFLRIRPMRYLGRISYSLYMWHTMVMFPLKIIIPKMGLTLLTSNYTFAIYAILSLVLSIIVSHLSYKYVEIRLSSYLKQHWIKKPGEPTTTSIST